MKNAVKLSLARQMLLKMKRKRARRPLSRLAMRPKRAFLSFG